MSGGWCPTADLPDVELPVNELFETLQGEATYTGTPSVFVRLQGCDVGCPWCDTRHTWERSAGDRVSVADMVGKTHDAPSYAVLGASQLAQLVASKPQRHVVITGGEPAAHDLRHLTRALVAAGRSVQIETSATYPVECASGVWLTISPKPDMPGGRAVLVDVMAQANEIKMPVGKPADVQRLEGLLQQVYHAGGWHHLNGLQPSIWLQPLSTSKKATELCISAASQRGWRVSLQTHKFAGLR